MKSHFIVFCFVLSFVTLVAITSVQTYYMDQLYKNTTSDLLNIYRPDMNPYFWIWGYNHTSKQVREVVCEDTVVECTSALTNRFINGSTKNKSPDLYMAIPNYDSELSDLPTNPSLYIGLLILPLVLHLITLLLVDNKYLLLIFTVIVAAMSIGFIVPMEQNTAQLNDLINGGFHNGTILGLIQNYTDKTLLNFNTSGDQWVKYYNCTSNIDCFQKIWRVWTIKEVGWIAVINIYPYEANTYVNKFVVYSIPIYVMLWIILTFIVKIFIVVVPVKEIKVINEETTFFGN